jgi:hypothetical protein
MMTGLRELIGGEIATRGLTDAAGQTAKTGIEQE